MLTPTSSRVYSSLLYLCRYPRETDAGRREDSLIRAEEETVFSPTHRDTASIVTSQQESIGTFLTIFFWREDGDTMLNTLGLAKVKEVEQYVFEQSGFENVCFRDSAERCAEADSLTKFVYSEPVDDCNTFRIPNGNATTQAGPDVLALLEPILNASASPVYCDGCGTGCSGQGADALNDYVVSSFEYPNNTHSFAIKSSIRFGLPLSGYSNAYDRRKEQLDKIDEFIDQMSDKLLKDGFSSDGITVRAVSGGLLTKYFETLIWKDIVWVVLSIVLVGVFIFAHTKTIFLTAFGMTHVILSFPFSHFFMQAFFDIGVSCS